MSIQDFHSKLVSRNENNNALFQALCRLRQFENVRELLFNEEPNAGGWYPWSDASEHHRQAVAGA